MALTYIEIGSGSSGPVDLASDKVTGVLPVSHGGTNSSTALSNNRVIISSGSKLVEASAITATRALKSDSNGIPTHFDTTTEPSLTELSYVKGVTSAIQTQINAAGLLGATSKNIRTTLPSGWLWANGAEISRSTYSALFSAISTYFGIGDNSTTFNLPAIYNEISGSQATTDLTAARYNGALVNLQDGRYVFIGGHNGTAEQDDTYIASFRAQHSLDWATSTLYPINIYLHSASVLNDGRILVCGGASPTAVNNTYFGTVSGDSITWVAGTNLTGNRFGQSQVTLPDGRVLLTGGNNGSGAVTTTEFGTISGNTITWASGTALPAATTLHKTSVLPSGAVLLTGGLVGGSNSTVVRHLSISTNTITYTSVDGLPVATSDHSQVTLHDGRVLICGGDTAGDAVSTSYYGVPGLKGDGNYTMTWNSGPPLFQRFKRNTLAIDPTDRVLLVGGADQTNTALKATTLIQGNSEIIKVS